MGNVVEGRKWRGPRFFDVVLFWAFTNIFPFSLLVFLLSCSRCSLLLRDGGRKKEKNKKTAKVNWASSNIFPLFGFHMHRCTNWLRPHNPHGPANLPHSPLIWARLRGRYWSAKICRRHLLMTSLVICNVELHRLIFRLSRIKMEILLPLCRIQKGRQLKWNAIQNFFYHVNLQPALCFVT